MSNQKEGRPIAPVRPSFSFGSGGLDLSGKRLLSLLGSSAPPTRGPSAAFAYREVKGRQNPAITVRDTLQDFRADWK